MQYVAQTAAHVIGTSWIMAMQPGVAHALKHASIASGDMGTQARRSTEHVSLTMLHLPRQAAAQAAAVFDAGAAANSVRLVLARMRAHAVRRTKPSREQVLAQLAKQRTARKKARQHLCVNRGSGWAFSTRADAGAAEQAAREKAPAGYTLACFIGHCNTCLTHTLLLSLLSPSPLRSSSVNHAT